MVATSVVVLLLMQVSGAAVQSCLFLPNVHLVGGTVDEFPADEITACCVACSNSPCCIAYTFDSVRKRCFIKTSIGHSLEDYTMTSGLKQTSRKGFLGVTLKNTKIVGDNSNRLQLRSEEECRQYCQAYQVFSYGPQNEDGEPRSGECACTMRIKSISYHYGSTAEINPSQG
ncbi:hypothetical protein L5515_016914 [Caenorhabditis briggsae]|uniref:Apple domain-containing protein n=1 Tax=Caenorhabditis briggsae TaxID=6238 RepID=A0AAE9CTH0_CAEBR|nr:hypothetical protein L3Y34_011036 [Caenorhabditis briggsae]UMM40180.1 hypothetical protein L5515_016914 [Caenorhabditis briggsae]